MTDDRPMPRVPAALTMADGRSAIGSPDAWQTARRPEVAGLFQRFVYGRLPPAAPVVVAPAADPVPLADGPGTLHQLAVDTHAHGRPLRLDVALFLPEGIERPPVLLGMNFSGNHAASADPRVRLNPRWVRPRYAGVTPDGHATDAGRGALAYRWPIRLALDHGHAVATLYYGDVDPDRPDPDGSAFRGPHVPPGPDNAGSVMAWAWGLMRALDALAGRPDVDPGRVWVHGFSRLGKASLVAAAFDERFAGCVSLGSGCGGSALFRHKRGERIVDLNRNFPHWFCDAFKRFDGREEELPVDQHLLMALVAPRPLLVGSASLDDWADPTNEFYAAKLAAPVYRLLGHDVDLPDVPPPVGPTVGGRVGYFCRPGPHDVVEADWRAMLAFTTRWGR